MFPSLEEGTWTFTKIREARDGEKEDLIAQAKGLRAAEAAAAAAAEEEDAEDDGEEDDDTEEGEVKEGSGSATAATPEKKEKIPTDELTPKTIDIEEVDDMDEDLVGDGVYVEDEDDEEGAVWCIKEGKVVDWGCFFALLYFPPLLSRYALTSCQNLRPRNDQPDLPHSDTPRSPAGVHTAGQAAADTIRIREAQDTRFCADGQRRYSAVGLWSPHIYGNRCWLRKNRYHPNQRLCDPRARAEDSARLRRRNDDKAPRCAPPGSQA